MSANVVQPLSRSASRTGWSSTTRAASGLVAGVAATAVVLAGAAQPAGAVTVVPTPPKTVTCQYVLRAWPGAFIADIIITNTGRPINGWVVHWTFDTPSKITSVWSATITDGPAGVFATNAVYNAVIPTGQEREFGWTALAATTDVPTDLTINGQPC